MFHKNDGYVVPIVLNPFRDEGKIDLRKEYDLTNYRLSAILIEATVNNREFIDGYNLESIKYHFDPSKVLEHFKKDEKWTDAVCVENFINEVGKIGSNSELTFGEII